MQRKFIPGCRMDTSGGEASPSLFFHCKKDGFRDDSVRIIKDIERSSANCQDGFRDDSVRIIKDIERSSANCQDGFRDDSVRIIKDIERSSANCQMTMHDILNSALDEKMSTDPKVFLMGEEITKGLREFVTLRSHSEYCRNYVLPFFSRVTGQPNCKMTVHDALNFALDEEMSVNPKVFLMGEKVHGIIVKRQGTVKFQNFGVFRWKLMLHYHTTTH